MLSRLSGLANSVLHELSGDGGDADGSLLPPNPEPLAGAEVAARDEAGEEVRERLAQMEQLVVQLKELVREKDTQLQQKEAALQEERDTAEARVAKLKLQAKAKLASLNKRVEELKARAPDPPSGPPPEGQPQPGQARGEQENDVDQLKRQLEEKEAQVGDLQVRLDQVQAEQAAQVGALQQVIRDKDARFEAQVRQHEDELVKLLARTGAEAEVQQALSKKSQQLEAELSTVRAALEAERQEARRAVEALELQEAQRKLSFDTQDELHRLSEQLDQADQVRAELEAQICALEQKHRAELEARVSVPELEAQISALERKHQVELEARVTLEQEQRARLEAQISALEQKHQSELEARVTVAELEAQISALEQKHRSELEARVSALEKKHRAELEAHVSTLEEKHQAELEARVSALEQEHRSELEARVNIVELETQVSTLEQKHQAELEARVGALEQKHQAELEARVGALEQEHQAQLEARVGALEQEHQAQLEARVGALEQEHRAELEARVSVAELEAQVGALEQKHQAELEARVSALEQEHWAELEARVSVKDLEAQVRALEQNHRAQLEARVSALEQEHQAELEEKNSCILHLQNEEQELRSACERLQMQNAQLRQDADQPTRDAALGDRRLPDELQPESHESGRPKVEPTLQTSETAPGTPGGDEEGPSLKPAAEEPGVSLEKRVEEPEADEGTVPSGLVSVDLGELQSENERLRAHVALLESQLGARAALGELSQVSGPAVESGRDSFLDGDPSREQQALAVLLSEMKEAQEEIMFLRGQLPGPARLGPALEREGPSAGEESGLPGPSKEGWESTVPQVGPSPPAGWPGEPGPFPGGETQAPSDAALPDATSAPVATVLSCAASPDNGTSAATTAAVPSGDSTPAGSAVLFDPIVPPDDDAPSNTTIPSDATAPRLADPAQHEELERLGREILALQASLRQAGEEYQADLAAKESVIRQLEWRAEECQRDAELCRGALQAASDERDQLRSRLEDLGVAEALGAQFRRPEETLSLTDGHRISDGHGGVVAETGERLPAAPTGGTESLEREPVTPGDGSQGESLVRAGSTTRQPEDPGGDGPEKARDHLLATEAGAAVEEPGGHDGVPELGGGQDPNLQERVWSLEQEKEQLQQELQEKARSLEQEEQLQKELQERAQSLEQEKEQLQERARSLEQVKEQLQKELQEKAQSLEQEKEQLQERARSLEQVKEQLQKELQERAWKLEQEKEQLQKELQEAVAARKGTLKKAREQARLHREQLRQHQERADLWREQLDEQIRENGSLRDQLWQLRAQGTQGPESGPPPSPGDTPEDAPRDAAGDTAEENSEEVESTRGLSPAVTQAPDGHGGPRADRTPQRGDGPTGLVRAQLEEPQLGPGASSGSHTPVAEGALQPGEGAAVDRATGLGPELASSRAEAARLEQLRGELQARLSQREEDVASLTEALAHARAESRDQKDLVAALSARLEAQALEHVDQTQRLRAELGAEAGAEARAQLMPLQRKLQAALVSRKEALKESRGLREELAEAREQAASLATALVEAEGRASAGGRERDGLAAQLEALQADHQRLAAEADRSREESRSLGSSCDSLKLALEGLARDKALLEQELGALHEAREAEGAGWQERQAELQREYETLLRSYENVGGEAERVQRLLEAARREKRELLARLRGAEAETGDVEKRLREAEQEMEGLRDKMRRFAKSKQQKILELEEENERLKAEGPAARRDVQKDTREGAGGDAHENAGGDAREDAREDIQEDAGGDSHKGAREDTQKDAGGDAYEDAGRDTPEGARKGPQGDAHLDTRENASGDTLLPAPLGPEEDLESIRSQHQALREECDALRAEKESLGRVVRDLRQQLEATGSGQSGTLETGGEWEGGDGAQPAAAPPAPSNQVAEAGPASTDAQGGPSTQHVALLVEGVPDPEKEEEEEELCSLRERLQVSEAQRDALESLLTARAGELETLQASVSALSRHSQQAREELAHAVQRHKELEEEKDDLEERLMNQLAELNGSIGDYQQAASDMQAANKLLEAEIQTLQNRIRELEEQRGPEAGDIAGEEAEGQGTQPEAQSIVQPAAQPTVRSAARPETQTAVQAPAQPVAHSAARPEAGGKSLTKELQELLKEKQQEVKQLRRDCIRYQEKISGLERTIKALEFVQSEAQKEVQGARASVAGAEEARQQARAELAACRTLLDDTQSEAARVLADSLRTQEALRAGRELAERQLKSRDEDLERRLGQAAAQHGRERRSLQEQLAALQREKVRAEEAAAEARAALGEQEQEAQRLQDSLNGTLAQLAALARSMASLQDDRDRVLDESKRWEDRFGAALQAKEDELRAAEGRCGDLRDRLRQESVRTEELQIGLARLQHDQGERESVLRAELQELQEAQEDLREEKRGLRAQLEESERLARDSREEVDGLRKQAEALRMRVAELEQALARGEEARAAAEDRARQQAAEIQSGQFRQEQLEADLRASAGLASRLQEEIGTKEQKLVGALAAREEAVVAACSDLQQRHSQALGELESRLARKEEEQVAAEAQGKAAAGRAAELEAQVAALREEGRQRQAQLDSFPGAMASLQDDRERLLSDYRQLEGRHLTAILEKDRLIQEAAAESNALREQLRGARAQLDDLHSHGAKLEAELARYRRAEPGRTGAGAGPEAGEEGEVERLGAALALSRRTVAELQEELARAREEVARGAAVAEARLSAELKHLHHDAGIMRNEAETAEERVAELAQDLVAVEQKLLSVNEENQSLRAQVQAFGKAMSSLQDSRDQAHEALRALRRERSLPQGDGDLPGSTAKAAGAPGRSTAPGSSVGRTSPPHGAGDVGAGEAEVRSLKRAMASLQNDRDRLLQELKNLQQQHLRVNEEAGELPPLKAQLRECREEADRHRALWEKLQEQSATWQQELQQLRLEKSEREIQDRTEKQQQQLLVLSDPERRPQPSLPQTPRGPPPVTQERGRCQGPLEAAEAEAEVGRLRAQLGDSLEGLHQKELRIQQLNCKLTQLFEEKSSLSAQLRGHSQSLRESHQRYSGLLNHCAALEERLRELQPQGKGLELLSTDAAPGAPQERDADPREGDPAELRELQLRFSEAQQEQSQLKKLLAEERDQRLVAEDALSDAQERIRRWELGEQNSGRSLLDACSPHEQAVLIEPTAASLRRVRSSVGWRRALRSLCYSRTRGPLLAAAYLLTVHVVLLLCLTGHL
ncbi:golgin subfamily B member 1 [Tachyglossus aculeatus]|uniref:golgin subfamily B member 1 n=1 Tax=Tachyglossus aculeatus TaxID=9261 RepID=UPI0018F3D964|nr:golgin subfamily B member 1 [Tachyglossus aculeatus]